MTVTVTVVRGRDSSRRRRRGVTYRRLSGPSRRTNLNLRSARGRYPSPPDCQWKGVTSHESFPGRHGDIVESSVTVTVTVAVAEGAGAGPGGGDGAVEPFGPD